MTLRLIGVPWPQRDQITNQYPGGVPQFIRDALETVVTELPFQDNYFWRVYFQGHYTPDCCPEYLKPENFDRCGNALPRLKIHTATVTDFLRRTRAGPVEVRAAGSHGLDGLATIPRAWSRSGTRSWRKRGPGRGPSTAAPG